MLLVIPITFLLVKKRRNRGLACFRRPTPQSKEERQGPLSYSLALLAPKGAIGKPTPSLILPCLTARLDKARGYRQGASNKIRQLYNPFLG